MLEVDGSMGEGGGQVLRTALTLSCLTKQPIRLSRVRAGREKPGLAAQHLTCVRAAAAVCGGSCEGDRLGSTELEFFPASVVAGHYCFDVSEVSHSAGSAGLVLQTVLPALLFAGGPSTVVVRGGTHVPWSPHFHYLERVFVPAVARLGVRLALTLVRGGFYPQGGGELVAAIEPVAGLLGCGFEHRRPHTIGVLSAVGNLPDHIIHRQADAAVDVLKRTGCRVEVERTRLESTGKGTVCFCCVDEADSWAGSTSLGAIRKPAEKVGREAARGMVKQLRAGPAFDPHLADQLMLYAALAEGETRYSASQGTLHMRTNADVIRLFLPVDSQLEERDGRALVKVRGVGWRRA